MKQSEIKVGGEYVYKRRGRYDRRERKVVVLGFERPRKGRTIWGDRPMGALMARVQLVEDGGEFFVGLPEIREPWSAEVDERLAARAKGIAEYFEKSKSRAEAKQDARAVLLAVSVPLDDLELRVAKLVAVLSPEQLAVLQEVKS